MFGLQEIEATQETIRELRRAGKMDRATAVAAVLAAATPVLTTNRTTGSRPFMTTGEVARALGVTIQTVKNWAAAGRFPMVQMGGRNYVQREHVLGYLDALRTQPRAGGPFDGPGVPDDRVRSNLPEDLVTRIDRYHEDIERGDPLSADAQAELSRLEATAARLTAEHLTSTHRGHRG